MLSDVLRVVMYFLMDFVKLWLVFWGIMNFPPKKNKKVYLFSLITVILLLLAAAIEFDQYQGSIKNLLTILVLIIIFVLFQGKPIKRISYSLLGYIIVLFIDLCVTGIVSLIINVTLNGIAYNNVYNYICNLAGIPILGAVVLIRKLGRRKVKTINLSRRIYALLFAGVGTGTLFIGSLMISTFPAANDRMRRLILIITIIACFAYCAACLMLVIISDSRDNFKALSQINQKVIESQQQYYMLVQEKEMEIHSIRHEMKNYLAGIDALYKKNNLQEMDQYIRQLIEQTETVNDLFDTGNDIVNAILNDAESRYRKDGIEIHLEGGFPSELHINSMDLCVIFANAVNNAVEAIQKIERNQDRIKFINIKISSFKDDLFIDVTNPVAQKVELSGGSPETTKKDKSSHGFGTKNMKQRAEKYQGAIQFISEDNNFKVEIHMKNK